MVAEHLRDPPLLDTMVNIRLNITKTLSEILKRMLRTAHKFSYSDDQNLSEIGRRHYINTIFDVVTNQIILLVTY